MKNESDNRGLLRIRLTSLFFLYLYIFFLFRIKTRKGNASTYQIARTAIPAAIKNPNTAPIRIPSASTLVVPDKSIFIEIMITIYGIPIGTPYSDLQPVKHYHAVFFNIKKRCQHTHSHRFSKSSWSGYQRYFCCFVFQNICWFATLLFHLFFIILDQCLCSEIAVSFCLQHLIISQYLA